MAKHRPECFFILARVFSPTTLKWSPRSLYPAHQRQFLLRTASPQQLQASVQVLYNIVKEYILNPEENKRNVLPYKRALVNLAETNVPYKTKKRILVQEGDGFIQDLLVPTVTSLGFLML